MSIQRFVGIDVSKADLAIHVLPDALAWTQADAPEGHACLVDRLVPMGCQRIVLEASGGYERAVLQVLAQAGLPTIRLPAHRPPGAGARVGPESQDRRTDALDARLLAVEAHCIHAPPTAVLPAPLQALRERLLRRTLVAQRDAQRRCLAPGHLPGRTRPVGRRDRAAATAHQRGVRTDRTGRSGVFQSAQSARAWPDPARRPGGSASRAGHRTPAPLVGLAPFNRDSGRWRGQRRIQGACADLRRVLSMATWASIRTGSPLSHTYTRLTAAGKPAKVAIVACMHKYLRWLNAIARDRAPYAPPTLASA